MLKRTCLGLTAAVLVSASASAVNLEELLRSDERLATIVNDAETFRLQVVLGTIDDGPGGPVLVQQSFRADAEYFYPASTIKLFGAVVALERLAEMRAEGVAVDATTPLTYRPLFEGEVLEDADPSNLCCSNRGGGTITVAHEIRKLFLVSDNRAYNRLYDLVGRDVLNDSLRRAGISSARLVHRLANSNDGSRAPRIEIGGHVVPERTFEAQPELPPIAGIGVGDAHMRWDVEGGRRVDEPLDMSAKNRVALADLQRALAMVVRPDVDAGGSFRLGDADRDLLLAAMEPLPGESANPVYDRAKYPDDYVKFLLPGLLRVQPREKWRIYNKVGLAYGFTIENAYVVDVESGRSFFLAATVYTNEDGVVNDDNYEYDDVALPFFADLGEVLARAFLR